MADYDIAAAFEAIENELIDSMIRNFKLHRAEETKEGCLWSQWQAEQLKSLEQYRARNAKKFNRRFSELNGKVADMLRKARADGNADQEAGILEAIGNGFRFPSKPRKTPYARFFGLNDRKLNALIKATTDDLTSAETAILRMSNDQYRKAIYNAQVYANTGAATYEKAVDMACRDMLRAGLNCVEYKNGARHTLSDYAEMAIRTANKRAYLYGEGQKRQEWGIHTVVVNSRQGGCPLCTPYIGKVFIDDVYSGGKKADGDYPLLSDAIKAGLFHPNCKDSTSTYYEGITTLQPVTEEEQAEMERREKLEAKENYCKNEAKKNRRIAEYSLDPDNQRIYSHRAEVFEQKAQNAEKALANLGESGIINTSRNEFHSHDDPMFEVTGSAYNSNPQEVQEILNQLKEWGVSVNHGSKTLGYGCIKMGEPGVMSVSNNASYSAWLHEFQHVKDDMLAGWDGNYVLWCDPEERIRREKRAYAIEIDMAKSFNRNDIVKRLEANLSAEIERIWKDFNKYGDYL